MVKRPKGSSANHRTVFISGCGSHRAFSKGKPKGSGRHRAFGKGKGSGRHRAPVPTRFRSGQKRGIRNPLSSRFRHLRGVLRDRARAPNSALVPGSAREFARKKFRLHHEQLADLGCESDSATHSPVSESEYEEDWLCPELHQSPHSARDETPAAHRAFPSGSLPPLRRKQTAEATASASGSSSSSSHRTVIIAPSPSPAPRGQSLESFRSLRAKQLQRRQNGAAISADVAGDARDEACHRKRTVRANL